MATGKTLLVLLIGAFSACAVPVSHRQFSIGGSSGHSQEFASSRELLVSGLVTEAMIFSKSNRFFEAESRLRQADYLNPGNERLQFDLALVIGQTGQGVEARELLQQLLAKKPEDPNLLMALADIEFVLGSSAEARDKLKGAFLRFKEAGNTKQAARIARSISNVAFAEGREQEALCYSFEAWMLAPEPQQLAWHARMLIAQNLFKEAEQTIRAALAKGRALGRNGAVQHALGLARYGQGDYVGALAAEEQALDLIAEVPEMGGEISAAWWLFKRRSLAGVLSEQLEEQQQDLLAFRERGGFELVTWPPALRAELEALQPKEG